LRNTKGKRVVGNLRISLIKRHNTLSLFLICRAEKEPHYTEPNFIPPTAAAVTPSSAASLMTKNNLLSNIPLKTEILKNNISSVANGTLAKAKKIYL